MNHSLIAQQSIVINSSSEKIWEVLTQPEYVKQFLFGTEVSTDWKENSTIAFKGNYEGTEYHDKGVVHKNKKHEVLKYGYWSSFSGLEDKPENYATVSYLIKENNASSCEFTWHQQGFSSEEGKCHTEEGLKSMLEKIKALAEG